MHALDCRCERGELSCSVVSSLSSLFSLLDYVHSLHRIISRRPEVRWGYAGHSLLSLLFTLYSLDGQTERGSLACVGASRGHTPTHRRHRERRRPRRARARSALARASLCNGLHKIGVPHLAVGTRAHLQDLVDLRLGHRARDSRHDRCELCSRDDAAAVGVSAEARSNGRAQSACASPQPRSGE